MQTLLRSFVGHVALLACCANCHRARALAASPPALNEPAGGPVCSRAVPTDALPATLFHEARRSAESLGLTPAVVDSVNSRILVAGERAPRARGTAVQQRARLTLEWKVLPPTDSGTPYRVYIAPGVTTWPAGLSTAENLDLALQSGKLSAQFMRRVTSAPNVFEWICNKRELQ